MTHVDCFAYPSIKLAIISINVRISVRVDFGMGKNVDCVWAGTVSFFP